MITRLKLKHPALSLPHSLHSRKALINTGHRLVIAGCRPGQKGTKKLTAEFGDALVCVRYRYDEASCTRIKTVELIVERTSWQPPPKKYSDNDLVPVRIGF